MVTRRVLDLCSGFGGWSDGFVLEGFKVLGIEIDPVIARMYPYPVKVADIRELEGSHYLGYDVIVGSPPCRDFTKIPDVRYAEGKGWKVTNWKKPKNPQEGLSIVNAFLRIVAQAKPKIWLMENVIGLTKHLELKPMCYVKLRRGMKRVFYGNFPPFLIPQDNTKKLEDVQGKYRKWERAKIPIVISRQFARVCKTALEMKVQQPTLDLWNNPQLLHQLG